ncbi:Protein of unknown function [Geosporobacter subterraneus DSM 17957]|uniref:DUF3810 domain-containing protein n=1 Tax=Geosporobacter subterraneus DSM 17957 TaxID=1121919 RepID=A0A1M6MHH9_9FIRM|nr:DUF3810 domain-containing protein [Geosporobacter subterraneus]SHJ82932.1 Protein of unknown function [Geosporobacter subterraneus DSM 17957]
MRKQRFPKKLLFLLLLPLSLLFTFLAAARPLWVEQIYSNALYLVVQHMQSLLTGFIPFSVGEFIVVLMIFYLIFGVSRAILQIILKGSDGFRLLGRWMIHLLISFCFIYFSFVILWGLNYYRLPFSEIVGLNTQPASIEELADLSESLIARANELRTQVEENEQGVMFLPKGKNDMFRRAHLGYDAAAAVYPELQGSKSRPKGIFFSHAMAYTGISGIYFPFTGEANVNTKTPDALILATTTHEMAHQRGFAREDEANYIAYLTATHHPDPDFQYSGVLLALINVMNQLYRHDQELYKELRSQYSPGIIRDLAAIQEYNKRYEGPVERAHTKINNAYLKSNRQEDGVYSYGRMVDLLIAEYRLKNQ